MPSLNKQSVSPSGWRAILCCHQFGHFKNRTTVHRRGNVQSGHCQNTWCNVNIRHNWVYSVDEAKSLLKDSLSFTSCPKECLDHGGRMALGCRIHRALPCPWAVRIGPSDIHGRWWTTNKCCAEDPRHAVFVPANEAFKQIHKAFHSPFQLHRPHFAVSEVAFAASDPWMPRALAPFSPFSVTTIVCLDSVQNSKIWS